MRKKSGRSIADIAVALHVSPSTVSRALSSNPSISCAMTKKVLEEARRRGYISSKRKNLVILLPDNQLSNYECCMLNALCRQCNANNLGWEIASYGNLRMVQERLIHGIISLDYYHDTRSSLIAGSFHLPLVVVNEFPNISEEVYSISSDDAGGINQALKHLKKLGHNRIIYLYSINRKNYCSARRLEAFCEIGGKMNLVCSSFPIMISAKYGNTLVNIVRKQMNNGFTAAIAEGETIGIHVGSCLQREGIRIPEDLSLITWNIPGVSEHLSPPMTTIQQDFSALAEAAVNAVTAIWSGEALPFSSKIPYIFFERESTSRR